MLFFSSRHARGSIIFASLNFILISIMATFCSYDVTVSASGQSIESHKVVMQNLETFESQHPVSCESFAALIDNAVIEWRAVPTTHLIIIARAGSQDSALALNKVRLRKVESYLKRFREKVLYVTAEGSRMKGLGRIEVYVGGSLRTVIPIERNSSTVCSGKVNPFL